MATGCSDKGDMKEGCFNGRGEAASLAAVGWEVCESPEHGSGKPLLLYICLRANQLGENGFRNVQYFNGNYALSEGQTQHSNT